MDVAAAPARERIDWKQVRLLFAANWRVWINRISQRPTLLVANIVFLVMMSGVAVAVSAALGLGIHELRANRPDIAPAVVHEVLLLGFRANEFLDVTKLFVYPVGHRTVFAATLCGLMGSGAVVFFSVPLFTAVIGYGGSPGDVAAGLASAVLLLFVAVALGQFLLLAFLNTLRSRKWRDVSMVLVPLVVGGLYVTFSVMSRREAGSGAFLSGTAAWFETWRRFTLPLPSWWAAEVVTGAGWPRFLPVAALVAVTAWLVRASAVLQEKAYYGDVAGDSEVLGVSQRGVFARIAARIRGPLGALVEKEVAILRREPAVRSILIGQAMYPIMWCGFGTVKLVTKYSAAELSKWVPLAGLVAYPLLLMELGLVMNLLGLEGGGAVHAMLLPVKRRVLLLGKDVAYLLVFGTLNAAVAVVLTIAAYFLTLTPDSSAAKCATGALLGALEGYCVVAIGLGIGNMMSVVNPIRVAVRDRRAIRQQVGGRDGCLRNLVGVGAVMGSLFLAVPIALLFHLAEGLTIARTSFQLPDWIEFVTVPAAVALSAGVLLAGAALGGSLLATREEDILARLTKSEE